MSSRRSVSVFLGLCVAMLAGCGGSVEPEPADECEAFKTCAANKAATVVCDAGTCSCVASLPGENRVVSCKVGAS